MLQVTLLITPSLYFFSKKFDHINWFVILKVWLIPSLLDGVEKYQYEFSLD